MRLAISRTHGQSAELFRVVGSRNDCGIHQDHSGATEILSSDRQLVTRITAGAVKPP